MRFSDFFASLPVRRPAPRSWPALLLFLLLFAGCGGSPSGDPIRFTVPRGSSFGAVTDTLAAREIIDRPSIFSLYARMNGAAGRIRPGVYEVQRGIAWSDLLDKLTSGEVVKLRITIPEGWTVSEIAARIAQNTGESADSLVAMMLGDSAAARMAVPGPTLEGYVYPATYVFSAGTSGEEMLSTMVRRYQQVWTAARRARADSIGMTERDVVTLASIVEKEARKWGERDTISAVYHNRLRIGMALQADPTVQYALGTHQTRLLYSHIDSVADHPYNTYSQRGLPPGPIASPSEGSIDAALSPAAVDYLYFVARPNGSHIFTRSLTEHNLARREAARLRESTAPPSQ